MPSDKPSQTSPGPGYEPAPQASPRLTDLIDLASLQQLQDGFVAVTGLDARILDAQGDRPITEPTDLQQLAESDSVMQHLVLPEDIESADPIVAPVMVGEHRLGMIRVDPVHAAHPSRTPTHPAGENPLVSELADQLQLDGPKREELTRTVASLDYRNIAAAVRFLYLLANHIARLCYERHQASQRVEELSTLYELSQLLAKARDLEQLLNTAARTAAETLKTKAASIRLLDPATHELVARAVYNLSPQYLIKGPVLLENNPVDRAALQGEVVYVEDMASDPRTVYKQDAAREGLASILVVGMTYRDAPVGVIRLYSGYRRRFNHSEKRLLQAIAQLLAAAIENARLDATRIESEGIKYQVKLGADVQRRMLPARAPKVAPFEIAARYLPSFDLGGDFYDYLLLEGHVGIAVGDVVGKGVGASLLMASVRASLRAYAQDLYDLDEIIARVNSALVHDTLDNEFATLFYGVMDPQTRRLTYCNAGHEPPLLLRGKQMMRLETGGMIVGVDSQAPYDKGIIDLEPGDLMLVFTDGLIDAMNFSGQRFGRDRVIKAMRQCQHSSAHETVNHVLWEMRRFVGLNRRSDDTTLVAMRVMENHGLEFGAGI